MLKLQSSELFLDFPACRCCKPFERRIVDVFAFVRFDLSAGCFPVLMARPEKDMD
ncbi:MAG: hypothetical protein ACOC32_04205 [Nanoarchaeota archaeon]